LLIFPAVGLGHPGDIEKSRSAGVMLPVKVFVGVAVTSESSSRLLARGTVSEGNMPVRNVVEEVNLALVQHETSRNRVNRSIAPTLVEEAAITSRDSKKSI